MKEERDKMMKVADKLDSHVTQLMLELEKKSIMLNETLETLKKREQSLSRERELFEEKVQWEYNHLQVIKVYLIFENKIIETALSKNVIYLYVYIFKNVIYEYVYDIIRL